MDAISQHFKTGPAKSAGKRKTWPYRLLKGIFLNMAVPGLGQIYLKQRWFGAMLAMVFLGTLVAALLLFAHGYQQYFDVFTADMRSARRIDPNLDTYHTPWLIALSSVAFVDYVAALVFLFLPKTAPSRQED